MSKAGQLAIALMCGMDRDHAIVRSALSDPTDLATEMLAGVKPSKEDLLNPAAAGETFFQYSQLWENLDRIVRTLRDSGSEISGTELCRTVVLNGKTALDYAVEKGCLKEIFSPEIWKGDLPAMEKAWFAVPRGKREMTVFRQLRSAIAAAAGQELREDVLDRMGVNIFNLRSAIKGGDYKEIGKKFAAGGDHLRAADVFLPDSYGDHMLDTRESWDNFEKLVVELDSHGERFEKHHFLYKNHDCKSALEEALSVNQARKIFTAKVWCGRMPEMLALYENIPAEKRRDVPLDNVLKELEEDIFGSKIDIAPGLAKGALTALMNDAAQPDTAGLSAVRGIGLKKVWENISDVREFLRDAGEAITIDDLRLTSGQLAESAMLTAARHGKFAEVIAILRENNDEFSVEDLTVRGKGGKNIIEILAEKKQLDLVCRAEFWAHRPQDFQKLWKAVPEKSRDQINYQDLLSRMNLISLRTRFGGQQPRPAL